MQLRGILKPSRLKMVGWLLVAAAVVAPSLLHSQIGIGFSPVLTGSMRPYAHPGDVFVTKTVKASSLHVGDIIAVHNPVTGVFYAHRIFSIRQQNGIFRIITKGDANPTPELDPFLASPNSAVSKEILRLFWVGRPLVYLASYQGRQATFALLIIANVLGIFYFLFRKKKVSEDHGLRVYKELYQEEKLTSDKYKKMLDEQHQLGMNDPTKEKKGKNEK